MHEKAAELLLRVKRTVAWSREREGGKENEERRGWGGEGGRVKLGFVVMIGQRLAGLVVCIAQLG